MSVELTYPSDVLDDGLGTEVEEKATELMDGWDSDPDFPVLSPVSCAAAAEYAAKVLLSVDVTQAGVGEKYDVSEVCIRDNYQRLLHYNTDYEGVSRLDSGNGDYYPNIRDGNKGKHVKVKFLVEYDVDTVHLSVDDSEPLCDSPYDGEMNVTNHGVRKIQSTGYYICERCTSQLQHHDKIGLSDFFEGIHIERLDGVMSDYDCTKHLLMKRLL